MYHDPAAACPALLTLRSGAMHCSLAPTVGGCVVGLWWRGVPVLRAGDPVGLSDPDTCASYALVPYSNRVGGGQLPWQGHTHALYCNHVREGHALHGVGWLRAWDVLESNENHATLVLEHQADAHWPFDFRAQQEITLEDNALVMHLQVRNTGAELAPMGLGWHPYFVKRAGARVHFAAERRWDMGEDMLPVLARAHPGLDQVCDELDVDHCFEAVQFPVTLQDALLEVKLHADVPYLVAFTTPVHAALALEPVTHVNNAAQLAQGDPTRARALGLQALEPGQQLAHTMRIEVRASAAA